MIYVTGDCHADFSKFSIERFLDQKYMTKNDFVIVCGDFGLWHDNPTEQWWFKWIEEKNFTLLFVDGNHENFDRLYGDEFEIVDFYGGKAHKIRDNIYHLIRGHIFELEGKKFFAFGGASSHDIDDGILNLDDFESDKELVKTYNKMTREGKMVRINHLSWWKEELPSEEEMEFGKENLKSHGNKVDYIITHCCPQEIASLISNGQYKHDSLTDYFNEIKNSVKFDKWFFGHYHREAHILCDFEVLYRKIIRIM